MPTDIQDPWDIDILGAMGELSVAKSLGIYWDRSFNTFKNGGDVMSLQVRTTKRDSNCLIVRDDDKDSDVFVLVTGSCPTFNVQGFITGKKAKMPEWKKAPNGRPAAFFVPQDGLLEMERLKRRVHQVLGGPGL